MGEGQLGEAVAGVGSAVDFPEGVEHLQAVCEHFDLADFVRDANLGVAHHAVGIFKLLLYCV